MTDWTIAATPINKVILDCLVAAERCVTYQKVHGVSNATITSIATAIKAARPGWAPGGVYANTHSIISSS
jgi:hypothetical protein